VITAERRSCKGSNRLRPDEAATGAVPLLALCGMELCSCELALLCLRVAMLIVFPFGWVCLTGIDCCP
jgi:hypothetical protein